MLEGLLLQQRLDAVRDALRLLRRRRAVVAPLLISAAVTALLAWQGAFGWLHALWAMPVVAAAWALMARWLAGRKRDSDLDLARRVEACDPEIDARLITAVELLDHRKTGADELPYLERRVIGEALEQGDSQDWIDGVTHRRLAAAARWATLAVWIFVGAFLWLAVSLRQELRPHAAPEVTAAADVQVLPETNEPLTFVVTPGDVEVELDSRLVVEAKMAPRLPAEARLVWTAYDGTELGSVEMRAGVDGETFGAMIPRVEQNLRYHVEAEGSRSDSHAVTTFVYPKLESLDVVIKPPAHTGLSERELRNTRKVTAPEFSELRFKARVNKPVAQAELFGEDKTSIPLKPGAEGELVLEGSLRLEKSGRYRLHLVDDKERANVKPPWITLTAQPNTLARIEVVFPKRDLQVSALQELPVEARVWDDIGVMRSGATVTVAGQPREVVFGHAVSMPNKKLDLSELINLEREGAQPRQLVSYHFWAEDTGPKGEVRRALSDMFFAQVRPFEDIFREAEPPPPGGMPGGGQQAAKLMELQKQVVNANWRLMRDTGSGRAMQDAVKDISVVRESENLVLEQAKEQMEEAEDAEIKQALTEAWKSMREAIEALEKAEKEAQRPALTQALEHEQAALQWLYQAGEREHLVTRQNRSQSAGGSPQERQEQIMSLELKQEEQRYEEERQAMAEQSPQQQENLEVLNRLKELARRQEALAKKMQELKEQMAKAESESQRQELAEQLQRLQQEQEDLLRNLDDLQDKMQQSDNAAQLAETREQLDQAREQALDATEQLQEQNLTAASNAATRAERELKQMEEDFREKTARRFSEEMRRLKREVQEVAQAQERISEALEDQKTPEPDRSGDTSNAMERMLAGGEVSRELAAQQERVGGLLENMQQISEQAESGEPVLSRRLYEAVRGAQTGGLEEQLEEARMQSRYGNRADAQEAERKAATAVEQLARNVEKAAEAVLGSEAEALRMARGELDRLIEEAEKEGQTSQSGQEGQGVAQAESKGESGMEQDGRQPGQGRSAGEQQGKEPDGQPSDASDQSQQAQANGESKGGQPGPGQEGREGEGSSANAGGRSQGLANNEREGGQGTGGQPGRSNSQGEQQGQGAEARQGGERGQAGQEPRERGGRVAERGAQRSPGAPSAGGNRNVGGGGGDAGGWFFDEPGEAVNQGPLTGEGFRDWADRLGMVEELLSNPELANEAARISDNARAMRIDHHRNNLPPQADELGARITQPLVELRDRVLEELARKGAENPTVPIDRDPVPPSYRDLVRRYYTELGEGR